MPLRRPMSRPIRRGWPVRWIRGPGCADSQKTTDANPQQKGSLWGSRLLFDCRAAPEAAHWIAISPVRIFWSQPSASAVLDAVVLSAVTVRPSRT